MRIKIVVFAFLLAVLAAGTAWAQSGSGSVRGVVQDQTGAIVVNVKLTLLNTATKIEFKSLTNNSGLYVFPAVAPGPYRLIAEFAGMKTFEATLTVRVEESETVNVTLTAGGIVESVVVQDVTPLVTTDAPVLGQTLETRRIEELPLDGRNVMSLMATVPGTTFDNMAGALRTFGEGPSTHDITIDGAPLTDMAYGENTVKRPPGLESVQEFRVETNATSARSPRPTDIVMITKSGTNEFHGSLFETNRDNGYGVARTREDISNVAAKLIRNEFGGSAGGPVFIPKLYNGKNKTFWFFSLENYRQRTGAYGRFHVPTNAMRNGDFTADVNSAGTLQKIYNPFETDPVTHQRQQFMYKGVPNTIDPALMSPLYKYILSVVPEPNQPGVNPFLAPNYYGPTPASADQSTFTIRIDQRIGDKDLIYGRISSSTATSGFASGGVPTLDKLGNYTYDNAPNKSLALDWSHTFSPTLFNDVTLSATRTINSESAYGNPTTDYASILGLPNPHAQPGFPVIGDIGLTSGNNYLSPATPWGAFFAFFVLEDNATKLVGKHEIQFGVHLRYDQLTYLPQQQRAAGSVSFPAIATALYDPNFPDRSRGARNTGSVAASAFIGASGYNYRLVKDKYYMRRNEDAGYLQDNYKVTRRLTLNLGLRWDFNPFPTEKYGVFTSFDQKTNAIVLGNSLDRLYSVHATTPGYISALEGLGVKFETLAQAGLPSGFANNNWHDISPHVGFAYRGLEGSKAFVIRGGYALNYYPIPLWGWNDRMKRNTPFQVNMYNLPLTSSSNSPDGIQNWGLIGAPPYIAGQNSSQAINANAVDPASVIGNGTINAAFFDPNEPSARVHTWNLTLEKELAAKTVLRISYQGTHGSNLDMFQDLNQSLTSYGNYNWYTRMGTQVPGGLYGDQEIRPGGILSGNPTNPYSDIQEFGRYGWSNSNGGTVELERRFSKDFGFQVFYQLVNAARAGGYGWESSIDPTTSWPVGEVPTDLHARIKLLDYVRDTSIPQQEVRYNFIAELPFGRGKALGRNIPKSLDAVIGGWQVSGLGSMHSNAFLLPNDNYPTGATVQYYGHKYPIQDCRSGVCQAGWLLWNGYIPANQINQPNGIMGVPANYKPAAAPLWPYPANYNSLSASSDPNYDLYGTNTVYVTLKDGTLQQTAKSDLNPLSNQVLQSGWLFTTDASLFKSFRFKERMRLKVEADFFNVFNQAGNDYSPVDDTGVALKDHSMNAARTMQLSARFTW